MNCARMGIKLLPQGGNGDNKNNAGWGWGQSYNCSAGPGTKMLPVSLSTEGVQTS